MMQFTELKSWIALKEQANQLKYHLAHDWQEDITNAAFAKVINHSKIKLDFSNQKIDDNVINLLIKLAEESDLKNKIDALIQGMDVNHSENKPALHTALRAREDIKIFVDGKNIIQDVFKVRNQIKTISDSIRKGQWLGFRKTPIKDIVNIGIGGSDLGPRFCIKALDKYSQSDLGYHFVSDIDPSSFLDATANLNPETTLFIVSSKSFTTKETMENMKKAVEWIGHENVGNHFIAVTANISKAKSFGFTTILPIWDWVGGRFSLCSAINLITAIAIGYENFSKMLAGAHSMDKHFQESDFVNNLPVLLALIGIWNNNFINTHNLLLLIYSQKLRDFVPYVQQLDMESNGKSIDREGRVVNYSTGPIVWGGLGNQVQHSYLQLLYQGTHKLTTDFITVDSLNHHIINKMCVDKMRVLSQGTGKVLESNNFIPGNMNFNHIQLTDLSPETIGELVALYEHKIYVQSVIWNINPFDQPGVDAAKKLSRFLENKKQLSEFN